MNSQRLEAGRKSPGRLWSTLGEVFELLYVEAANASISSESLFQHMQFKAGQHVYWVGQPFDTLYLVNSGFLKTVMLDESGDEQVLSFPMKGDVLGMDGISTRGYASEAIALSDCDLILLPYSALTAISRVHAEVETLLYHTLSRELVRRQVIIGMLGCLSAEARVARFLVSLAERFVEIGCSSKVFNLRMTRQEIGSYLGLTLETVSRTLSSLNKTGVITLHQRTVGINDSRALETLRCFSPSSARQGRHKPGPGRTPPASPACESSPFR